MSAPLFELGQVVATPGALAALEEFHVGPLTLLAWHVTLDEEHSALDTHDKAVNKAALRTGARILSSYKLSESVKLWVITESDRSVTTILLPSEY